MEKLLLASTSPTRKRILVSAGIKFIYKAPLINEEKEKKKLINAKKPEKICQKLAKQKSIKTSLKYSINSFVITWDPFWIERCPKRLIFENRNFGLYIGSFWGPG